MLSGNGGVAHDHVVRFVFADGSLGFSQYELARPGVNRIDRQQATDRVSSESWHCPQRLTLNSRALVARNHYQLARRGKRPLLTTLDAHQIRRLLFAKQPRIMGSPLNVLFITADQWRGDCPSVLDHPFVRPPNLDAFAADRVL